MDDNRLKVAGTNLAIAAMRVVQDSDGLHRLSLAVRVCIGRCGSMLPDNQVVVFFAGIMCRCVA